MENMSSIVFAFIGLASLLLILKNVSVKYQQFLVLLLSISVVFLVNKDLSSNAHPLLFAYVTTGILSFHFIFSKWQKISENIYVYLLPVLASFGIYFAFPIAYTFNGYVLEMRSVELAILVSYGALIPSLITWLETFVSARFGIENKLNIRQMGYLLFIGFGVFLGSFFASNFGVLLFSIAVVSGSFYRKEENFSPAIALFLVALMHHFMQLANLEFIDLSLGKTLEGIFFGGFSVMVLHVFSTSTKHKRSAVFIPLFTVLIVLSGLLLLATQKADLGGMDAFIGSFVGIALTLLLVPEFLLTIPLFSFLIALGLLLAPQLINPEELALTQITLGDKSKQPKEGGVSSQRNPFDEKGLSLDDLTGKYKLNENTVQLNFQLGPKGGVTKGAFRKFSGVITIEPSIENSMFSITLPLNELTTFNSFRDKSLQEEGYFNSAKFPVILYKSNKLIPSGDGYTAKGVFTMLGISGNLDVQLKCIGYRDTKNGKTPILVGKSVIDRTLFGMKPDSKEGNIVTFEFKVELVKI
jgi:polyisoprenoid-binding protein YceI